jgi:predicted RNA-binding protein with PIN domain
MHYYIDGYNLLFRTLRAKGGEDLKIERLHLLNDLAEKLQKTGIEATVVFDSHYQIGDRTRHVLQTLDIHFTDQNQTADAFILECIHSLPNPQFHTVVTSDRHLAWHARCAGAQSQAVEAFRKMLNRVYTKKRYQSAPIAPKPLLSAPVKIKIETLQDKYERIFEEKLKDTVPEQASEHAPEHAKAPRRKKIPLEKEPLEKREENVESDFDRWLKAFENGA